MKIFKTVIYILALFFNIYSHAQATANSQVAVRIVKPVGISSNSNLDFVSTKKQLERDPIIVSHNTKPNSFGQILTEGNNISTATIELIGEDTYAFAVTLPNEGPYRLNGREILTLKNFTSEIISENARKANAQVIQVEATFLVETYLTPDKFINSNAVNIAINYN